MQAYRLKSALLIAAFLVFPLANVSAENLEVSLIAATSVADTLPAEIFNGLPYKPEPGAEYVKIHMHLNREIKLSHIAVESCENPLLSKITAYINFDEVSVTLKPDKNKPSSILVSKPRKFSGVRSVTLNFGSNLDLCIKDIRFYDAEAKPYTIIPDRLVAGSVKASTTLAPVVSYAVTNLFDSKYEYAWATEGESDGAKLDFNFKEDVTITAIKFWNGYQRSDVHCYSNSRLKTVKLTGDGDQSEVVSVKDVMGPQTIKLRKKFQGKKLGLEVASVWRGKKYKDLALSEMRFFDGTRWFMPDPSAAIKAANRKNRADFHAAGLGHVINKSVAGAGWVFRIRSDGSFYATGTGEIEADTKSYFALGNYEIKSMDAKSMSLRVFGVLREKTIEFEGDCNGCGRDCNQSESSPDGKESIFQDFIRIDKAGPEKVNITNTSKKRRLQFEVLEGLIKSRDP